MENFKFSLQKVLDIKVKNEDESKINYSKAQNEKREVEEKLKGLEVSYEKYSDSINIENIVERKITSNYLNFISTMIDEANDELNQKEEVVNKARVDLMNKQIERKSLEKLKDNKYMIHKKSEDHKEQIINDEFGMYAYLRNKSSVG